MNKNESCLTGEVILQIEEGRIPSQAMHSIESHVSTCDACRDTFDKALRSPEWTEELRPALLESSDVLPPFDKGCAADDAASLQADITRLLGPTDDPRMLGRIGLYEVAGVIGRGGMGIVFKAFDASLDRYVAIKMLAPHLATSGAARKRFVREGKAAAAVVDDHVMPVYAVDEWQGVPYLVMQYSRGRSLQQRLNEQGPLELKEILRIGTQAARGLAAAHAQGLVHRDVKPSNILLSDTVERAILMDFGLARAVDDASMTRTGTVAGTPQYMSPEQARAESIDQRSDLFSLGSVLYAMCTGRPPYRGDSAVAVLKLICDKEARPITEINSDIPPWLCDVIDRLMSKSPEQRFASAEEVADLLEECLAHVQQPEVAPLPASAINIRSAVSAENHGSGRRVARWLATALLLPAIFALGVVIVLEYNKGTLTITSEADVPIRIMQGDEVVKVMTVSSDGASVRISAGAYRVVIDGPIRGLTVLDGSVTVQRREEENVRIVNTQRSNSSDVAETAHGYEEKIVRQDTSASSLLQRLLNDHQATFVDEVAIANRRVVVDFYAGIDTLPEMNNGGSNTKVYRRLLQELNDIRGVTVNVLVIPKASQKNKIQLAVIRTPSDELSGRISAVVAAIAKTDIGMSFQPKRSQLVHGAIVKHTGNEAQVSLGADDGIIDGTKFTVIRGSQYVASMTAVSTKSDNCLAQIDQSAGIEVGDIVIASVDAATNARKRPDVTGDSKGTGEIESTATAILESRSSMTGEFPGTFANEIESAKQEASSDGQAVASPGKSTALVILSHPAELRNGNSIQQAAISMALGQLTAADFCGVLNYAPQGSQSTSWMWKDEKGNGLVMLRDRRSDLNKALAASRPGDFPSYDEALQLALDALSTCPAKNRHMLVLTDGDPTLQDESILSKFADAGITISVVHADLHGEPYYRIPKLMAQKTGGQYWVLNKKAPSSSFETLFRDATKVIKSFAEPKPLNPAAERRSSGRSTKSSWPNKNVEDWVWENFNSLVTVRVKGPEIQASAKGWIVPGRQNVVVRKRLVASKESEVTVQTIDGKIYQARVVGEPIENFVLLAVDALPFSGLSIGETGRVTEGDQLYVISSHFRAHAVKVVGSVDTVAAAGDPDWNHTTPYSIDIADSGEVELPKGSAIVTKFGKFAGILGGVDGSEGLVIPADYMQCATTKLLERASDSETAHSARPTTDEADPKMHVIAEEGEWTLEDGVTLQIRSREDKLFGEVYRAIINWKPTKDRPALSYEVDVAGDEHYKWAVAWEDGKSMIWLLAKGNYQSGSSIRSIDYSVPANIVTAVGYGDDRFDLRLPELTRLQKSRRNPFSIGSPWVRLPKRLDKRLVKHFGLGEPQFGISSLLPTGPYIPGGQYAESAILIDDWTFRGQVKDADGQPMPGVDVYATTAWSQTVKLDDAKTDKDGNYKLTIRLDLMTFAQLRRVLIFVEQPNAGLFVPSQADFYLRLSANEEPQQLLDSVRLELQEKKSPLPKMIRLPKTFAAEESAPVATPEQPSQTDFKHSKTQNSLSSKA